MRGVLGKARPAEKAYRLSDGGSLYLWVTPAGGKLWRWAYKHMQALDSRCRASSGLSFARIGTCSMLYPR